MNDTILSSMVFDKSNSRFSILNLYNEDEDINIKKNKKLPPNIVKAKFKKTIEKKEAFKTSKCYCSIM